MLSQKGEVARQPSKDDCSFCAGPVDYSVLRREVEKKAGMEIESECQPDTVGNTDLEASEEKVESFFMSQLGQGGIGLGSKPITIAH